MFKKIVGLGFSSKGKNAKNIQKYINSLVEGGATEFFTGYNPSYWSDKFGFEVSPNGRFAEHEQITDFETLKAIVIEVHKHNLEIFVNINAWYYTNHTMPLIKKMVNEFQEINIDGIICGNISILEYLKSIDYKGKMNVSTIMSVYNTEAINFLNEQYNINKFILSRELTLSEIENIVKANPDKNFEVFGEGDFCRYNNGLCFAEHKYGVKDICTVVVNDLIIKKRYSPNFKKVILSDKIENDKKIDIFDCEYLDVFEQIDSIFEKNDLGLENINILKNNLLKIILFSKNKIDLYFDALKPINSKHNKNIIIFLKGIKFCLNDKNIKLKDDENNILINLKQELEKSIKTGLQSHINEIKKVGGEPKLKAIELANFYSRGDNLNLYSYLFFTKFKNIDTVKFPTRGRNYNEKLKIIESVVKSGKIDEKKYLNRTISLERAHYDLTYIFGEKLWFRKMLQNIKEI